MSKAFDNFDFTSESPPPFWWPFVLSMLFSTPLSVLWCYMAAWNGRDLPLTGLFIGVLCALGTRFGNGDYSSTLLSTTIQITSSLLLIAIYRISESINRFLIQLA